jgi:hypothetical protein
MEFFLWLVGYACLAGVVVCTVALVRSSMVRSAVRHRAPAPSLNPRWDSSVCKHAKIEPVIPSGEEDIVAYLCVDPECYAQLELTDPAVQAHLKQERILKGWEHVGNSLEQAQNFAARTQAIEGGPYVKVQLDTAKFARETREAMDREAERARRARSKAETLRKQSALKVKRSPRGSWY